MCPYCQKTILQNSSDHIFSDFLGGRRMITACKPCNDRFGHSFEAAAAKILQAMHISISTWGLPLKETVQDWKSGHEYKGIKFDLSVDGSNIKLRLAKPVTERDERGTVTAVTFATEKEAEKAAENARKKGKSATVQKIGIELPFPGAAFNLAINRELNRTALKMCVALSTLLPNFSALDTEFARPVLADDAQSGPVPNVTPAFVLYDSLEALRQPLSHVIYVERNNHGVYGVVQFFGVIQLFCKLGKPNESSSNAAILGVLDPMTGGESFDETAPLLNLLAPNVCPIEELPKQIGKWLGKFEESAKARGATEPPNLSGNLVVGEY
jgi:hypothetical protein